MAESCYICNNHKTNYKIQKLYINEKGTSFISEIGKYFKNNDATSAMNKIMEITRTLNFSEKRLYGEESRYNCKYSQTVGSYVQRSSNSLLPAIASVTTLA